jgi:hypothetical protein
MSAATLAVLQHALQQFILRGAADLGEYVQGTAQASAGTRLAVYANAYGTRLAEALESNFPMLASFMGADEFRALARRYIEQHDSSHRSVRWYGDRLAQFLAADPRYRDAEQLADLAAWEWAMAEAFDAADAPCLTRVELTSRAPQEWADLKFRVHPSLRRLDLAWNAPQTWKALQDGVAAPAPECVSPPQSWLLWRKDLQLLFRSLDPLEAAVLEGLLAGKPFGELCVGLAQQLGEAEASRRAAQLLHGWVESGLISAIVAG